MPFPSAFAQKLQLNNLAMGRWFDAGDFDFGTGSHCAVLQSFADSWEQFHLDRDK